MRKQFTLSWENRRLELGRRTLIMGIVNVTPDSFSDGGKFYDPETAIAQGEKMAGEGADIIDIGGESTRPFSDAVSIEEESGRVLPVIESLAARVSVPISIDTMKAQVAARALDAGASIINDVSALRWDPGMGEVAQAYGVPIILMHMKGTPKTMQASPHYDDLIHEVKIFFQQAVERCLNAGIPRERIILDPGIGFGKTFRHNLCLIRRLNAFSSLELPLLVGASRKAFIRNILKNEGEKDMDPMSPVVETGSQAAAAAAILNGAHMLRVHNVANTLATVKLIDAIQTVSECV